MRNNLACFRDRLRALEEKVAAEGPILTESQVAAREKKRYDDEAAGKIEAAHSGYLGSQDTFYVGTLKGVGRVYQQTFVDTYSKVAAAKLYTTKTPITAADLFNDQVRSSIPQRVSDTARVRWRPPKSQSYSFVKGAELTEFCDKTFNTLKSVRSNKACRAYRRSS